ncbi:DUF1178 family protein [Microbaculum marinum]|uniref:DUF1178 family protein n=1 Tax=Microbaculum marinum TaxID=1764581 RepID=A0AAW9RAJ0_9HYPH
MIRYSLVCADEHEFEGWFRDSSTFDSQKASGEVLCPICGSSDIEKALMAPSVAIRDEAPAVSRDKAQVPMAASAPANAQMIETLRRLKQHVVENSEYVGNRFPEEARKIHYEEAERRSIYGEASLEDARSLIEDGVEVHPLPILPEEKN